MPNEYSKNSLLTLHGTSIELDLLCNDIRQVFHGKMDIPQSVTQPKLQDINRRIEAMQRHLKRAMMFSTDSSRGHYTHMEHLDIQFKPWGRTHTGFRRAISDQCVWNSTAYQERIEICEVANAFRRLQGELSVVRPGRFVAKDNRSRIQTALKDVEAIRDEVKDPALLDRSWTGPMLLALGIVVAALIVFLLG